MWKSFKATIPYPIYICINLMITFMLFPSLSLAKSTSLGPVWTTIVLLLFFNLGDFFGKLTADFQGTFNSRSITYLFFTRLFFFYTIPLLVNQFSQDDFLLNNNFFPFFNQFVFAFTNGLVTSNL